MTLEDIPTKKQEGNVTTPQNSPTSRLGCEIKIVTPPPDHPTAADSRHIYIYLGKTKGTSTPRTTLSKESPPRTRSHRTQFKSPDRRWESQNPFESQSPFEITLFHSVRLYSKKRLEMRKKQSKM